MDATQVDHAATEQTSTWSPQRRKKFRRTMALKKKAAKGKTKRVTKARRKSKPKAMLIPLAAVPARQLKVRSTKTARGGTREQLALELVRLIDRVLQG